MTRCYRRYRTVQSAGIPGAESSRARRRLQPPVTHSAWLKHVSVPRSDDEVLPPVPYRTVRGNPGRGIESGKASTSTATAPNSTTRGCDTSRCGGRFLPRGSRRLLADLYLVARGPSDVGSAPHGSRDRGGQGDSPVLVACRSARRRRLFDEALDPIIKRVAARGI
jgi:hypothetical protein